MTQIHRIAILAPLAVGLVAFVCTIMIHALPLSATVDFVRREKNSATKAGTSGLTWELLPWPYRPRWPRT